MTPTSPSSNFPFTSVLSLDGLITFWEQMTIDRECTSIGFASWLHAELAKAEDLRGAITDLGILEKHSPVMDALMTAVFPAASWESDLSCALVPFDLRVFYATPAFREKMMDADGQFLKKLVMSGEMFNHGKLIHAYLSILNRHYGIPVQFEYPIIASYFDDTLRIQRFFRLRFDGRFVDCKAVKPVKPLTDSERKFLFSNLDKPEALASIIPPDHFEFHGFIVINAVDVTDQELLSSLKVDLIERESLMTMERFRTLEQKIQSLLRRTDVRIGLAAMPPKNTRLSYGRRIGYSFLLDDQCRKGCESFENSLYARAIKSSNFVVVDDLDTHADPSLVELQLRTMGVRSLGIAPLFHQGETVGVLELCSREPGAITPLSFMKLNEVLSLFGMAIKRGNDELENLVQAVIKEKCTAIHPSVEWRFRKAALNLIQGETAGTFSPMEPIVFENVYPLYGLSDIRGSSTQRNSAIRSDLLAHLAMAYSIIQEACTAKPLPYLDELCHRIEKTRGMIAQGVNAGDEVSIIDFLHNDVESLFDHLAGFSPHAASRIAEYKASMDPHMGFLYRTRKDFEESVTKINDIISTYLDQEQIQAQKMFPHYFEKYKTDGVDHGMYIGGSLVEDREFDVMYLKNLRLWQLMVICGIVRKTRAVRESLPMPLDTAHLVLVQQQPLSIRFRFDEKKFDVDGAYNIRYEITKKRIDKATLKGSEERLTQPGKIAIVYSQPRESAEYRRYIDYLHSAGYLQREVENLELEDLQGVHGLRALRVAVNLNAPAGDSVSMAEVGETVRTLSRLEN